MEEPVADRRIGVDIDLPFGRIDQEQSFRLDAPALDVLSAQEGHQQFRRFWVLHHQPITRWHVDNESLVKASFDAVEWRTVNLA